MPDDQAGQIEVLNPQGQAGNIPLEQMDDALGQGYKLSKHAIMYDPQGKRGLVPKEQMADAMKAGYQTTPETQFEKEHPPKEPYSGFAPSHLLGQAWQGAKELGGGIGGMVKDVGNLSWSDLEHKYVRDPALHEQELARTAKTPSESIGHSIAEAIPVVGPWAAGLGEQAGTGDIGGAAARGGTQVGLGLAAKPILGEAAKRLPSKGDIGLALRTEKGALKPGIRSVAGLAGGLAGHYTGLPGGELGGFLAGRGLADAVIPARPTDIPTKPGLGAPLPLAGEFYENRAADLAKRGREQSILDRKAATEAQRGIVAPEAGLGEPRMTGNEGRAATWTNEMVLREAGKGNREAIQQAVRRGLELPPGARYVMGDPDFSRTVYNPKESTIFTPEGTPIRNVENPIVKAPRARIAVPEETRAPRLQGNAEAPPVQTQAVPLGERRTGNGQPPLGVVERRVQSQPVDLLSFNARRELARPDLTPAERSHFEGILADMKAHPESIGSGEQLAEAIRSETAAKPMSREKALANEARRKAKNQ